MRCVEVRLGKTDVTELVQYNTASQHSRSSSRSSSSTSFRPERSARLCVSATEHEMRQYIHMCDICDDIVCVRARAGARALRCLSLFGRHQVGEIKSARVQSSRRHIATARTRAIYVPNSYIRTNPPLPPIYASSCAPIHSLSLSLARLALRLSSELEFMVCVYKHNITRLPSVHAHKSTQAIGNMHGIL